MMRDPSFMHYYQSLEYLLNYRPRIIFIPPIAIYKGLGHISCGDVLHRNVHVVQVLPGVVELDEPAILSLCQTEPRQVKRDHYLLSRHANLDKTYM